MNQHIKLLIAISLTAFFIFPSVSFAQKDLKQKEKKALNAAGKFLALVDDGHYAKSYAETSTLFRRQISEQEWVSKISSVRPIFGGVIDRGSKKAKYETSVPGAPDGEFFLLIFRTSFKKKEKAIEFVTTNKDTDGKWRVSGYFIR